jgi:Response regulators consisting of a CheY-like receiver domain and a winged-helix DNA-binding domain
MNVNTTLHLLLIEDNPGDARLVSNMLKSSSVRYELYTVPTLFEGVALIENQEITLALLDLSLPDSNGFKTLTSFLQRCPKTPVIIMTGTNNELIGNQAIKAGALDFLVKGQFDAKLLGRAIRYALHRAKNNQKIETTARELAISEKRFVEAQEMAHFGNWEMDIVNNKMLWADEIFRIFGFPLNSMAPTLSDYISYTHPEDKTKVQDFFELAAKDGKLHHLTHRIVIQGRSIKHISIQAKMNFDEIRQKLFLTGTLQDITQQKITEELIIEKNINTKASKIKDEALADISFHIRTPLSSVINLLYLIEKTKISPDQTELIDGLKTSVDDLSIMVNNLLNFSVLVSNKIEAEKERFEIIDFLESMKRVVKMRTENSAINLEFHIDETMPNKIISDTKKITQILYNLIDYLIAKTKRQKSLFFKTSTQKISQKKYELIFTLHSEGLILDEEEIKDLYAAEKILEIYNPEEDEQKKLIIGMAIVSKLIKILDGNLSFESKEKSDTIFRVSIPVEIAKKSLKLQGDIPNSPLRILLVEDHFLNQLATKKVLTSWSNHVTVDIADNGQEAVEKYKDSDYDIILMDIQMPVMNGIIASQKIRETSSVPIVALTANASKPEEDKCLSIGINDYLSKPFKPEELYNRIMAILSPIEHQS